MYTSFELSGFRGLDTLYLPQLERVNLITGMSNVGKTSLLEALLVHINGYTEEIADRLERYRGISGPSRRFGPDSNPPWESLFHNFNEQATIRFASTDESRTRRTVTMRTRSDVDASEIQRSSLRRRFRKDDVDNPAIGMLRLEAMDVNIVEGLTESTLTAVWDSEGLFDFQGLLQPPSIATNFLSTRSRPTRQGNARLFSNLEVSYQQDILLDSLGAIDKRIKRFTIAIQDGLPTIHADIGLPKLMPLPYMGEGVNRLVSIVLAIANAQGGVVLIDEVENGLHYSILPRVW